MSELIFYNMLLRQNSVVEIKIFTKKSSAHETICHCDVSPQHVAAICICRLVCTDLKSLHSYIYDAV